MHKSLQTALSTEQHLQYMTAVSWHRPYFCVCMFVFFHDARLAIRTWASIWSVLFMFVYLKKTPIAVETWWNEKRQLCVFQFVCLIDDSDVCRHDHSLSGAEQGNATVETGCLKVWDNRRAITTGMWPFTLSPLSLSLSLSFSLSHAVILSLFVCVYMYIYIERFRPEWCISTIYIIVEIYHSGRKPSYISRVSDQNGVSHAWYIVEIHHSGRKPSICVCKNMDVHVCTYIYVYKCICICSKKYLMYVYQMALQEYY